MARRNESSAVSVYIKHLEELQGITVTDTGVSIGAAVSLKELKTALEKLSEELPSEKTKLFKELVKYLEPIGSEQILNAAVSRETNDKDFN